MSTPIEVYEVLRVCGLCGSKAEFSKRWLGRSGGHLAFLRSSGMECCPVSIQLLAERLQRCADELRDPEPIDADMPTITALRELHASVCGLAETVAPA